MLLTLKSQTLPDRIYSISSGYKSESNLAQFLIKPNHQLESSEFSDDLSVVGKILKMGGYLTLGGSTIDQLSLTQGSLIMKVPEGYDEYELEHSEGKKSGSIEGNVLILRVRDTDINLMESYKDELKPLRLLSKDLKSPSSPLSCYDLEKILAESLNSDNITANGVIRFNKITAMSQDSMKFTENPLTKYTLYANW